MLNDERGNCWPLDEETKPSTSANVEAGTTICSVLLFGMPLALVALLVVVCYVG